MNNKEPIASLNTTSFVYHFVFSSTDFIPSLRRLFKNSIYTMMILTYLVSVNGFIGLITFKPKFMEQVYGQSASKAIFLIGRV